MIKHMAYTMDLKYKIVRNLSSVLVLLLSCVLCFAQETDWQLVDIPPQFPGGQLELMKYVVQEVEYSDSAIINSIEGEVGIEFTILETGEIDPNSISVKKGLGYGLDEKAIQLVTAMPKWTPGKISQSNKKAPVKYYLPIRFNLSDISNDDWNEFYINHCMILLDEGKKENALAEVNKAISNNSKLADAYYARALVIQAQGDSKKACKDLTKAEKVKLLNRAI